jgi:hypothetical protein
MTILVNGKIVKTLNNDEVSEESLELPETSTVQVKAKSATTDTYLHMVFIQLKSCESPKERTSEGFRLDGHYFRCDDFETSSASSSTVSSSTEESVVQGASVETQCVPYSAEACRQAARAAGLELGGKGHDFEGPFSTKGCYSYRSGGYAGYAYYGTGAGDTEGPLTGGKYRPSGYDCS